MIPFWTKMIQRVSWNTDNYYQQSLNKSINNKIIKLTQRWPNYWICLNLDSDNANCLWKNYFIRNKKNHINLLILRNIITQVRIKIKM